jgi:pyruvate/2-oxoglutarate dehydrogenase complex dihydrolipoamide acyltransferase (E2) component
LPWLIRQRRLTARASPIRGELLVADGLGEHGADDQVGAADPAGGQPFAAHVDDEGLDVLAADDADRLAADRGVDVSAQHRPVGRDAAVGAQVLVQPGLGRGAERRLPGPGVDEDVGALVVLDLEREVLGLAPVIAEGLLALAAGPAAGGAVADHPLVRAVLPCGFGTRAAARTGASAANWRTPG